MATEAINMSFRVDKNLKKEADKLFKELGMNTSVALNMFLKQSVKAGKKLTKGETITFTIAKVIVTYPDFVNENYTLEQVQKFCEENDFIIVMISHVDNQIEHADKVYYINDGVISEEAKI